MLKHYSTPLLLSLFLLTLPASTYSMELAPLVQPYEKELFKKRKEFDDCMNLDNGSIDYEKMHAIFPNNTLEVVPKTPRLGVCFNFTMRECLGLSKAQFEKIEQSIVGSQDWNLFIGMPHAFFDQKQLPEIGNLATYHDKDNNNSIGHFAKVIAHGRLKSKIGTGLAIIEHDYWDLPPFGEHIYFWELKPMYRDQNGKILLFSHITNIIKNSVDIKLLVEEAQETLIATAAKKTYRSPFSFFVIKNNPFHLLQIVVGLKIDLPDNDGNTPLMLAAKSGNLACLTCLVEHGANLFLTNKDGKDVLDLANEYNHQDIFNYLSNYY